MTNLPTYAALAAAKRAGTLHTLLAALTPAERLDTYEMVAMQTGRTVGEVQRRIERHAAECRERVALARQVAAEYADAAERARVRADLEYLEGATGLEAYGRALQDLDEGATWAEQPDGAYLVRTPRGTEHRVVPGGPCGCKATVALCRHQALIDAVCLPAARVRRAAA